MALCSLSALAQIAGDNYYRVRNAGTNNYISIANNKFSYTTVISTAGGGLREFFWLTSSSVDNAKRRALACAGIFLQTDIHVVEDVPGLIPLECVIYADKKNTNSSNHEYNLIGQGISLLSLTTGVYPGTTYIHFSKRYITINPSSGSGANTQYTASIVLQADDYSDLATMGTRYFLDNDGTFGIDESNSSANAKWYVEPITYFNIEPELEFNGKYYTTIKVPFAITLNGQVEKAYTITAVDNKSLDYDVIATTGQTVPAGTPVILECGSPNAVDCRLNPVGAPLSAVPDTANKSAPAPNESSNYTGTNLLKGTYFCNTDGNLTFQRKSGTGTISCNNYKAITSPQKYVLGINAQGQLGFVKATAANTPNSKMPANKAWLELEGYFAISPPTFNPAGGTKNNPLYVTINCATPGTTIYYTTDGTDPTTSETRLVYTEPIFVEKTTTVKACAIKGNGELDGLFSNTSTVTSATYTLKVATPTFNPPADTYSSPQSVTISCATEGAAIYYTLDGTTPTNKKTLYTGPITVDHNMTIKAIAYKSPLTKSAVASAVYRFPTITADPAALTINDEGGSFIVTGRDLFTNVSVTPSNDFSTTFESEVNTIESWGFVSNEGSVDGTVNISYPGTSLRAEGSVELATEGYSTSVPVTYMSDIFIVTDNGITNQWDWTGTQMTNDNGIYTATFTAPQDNTFILFARKPNLGDSERWGTRYVFGPSSNNDWVMPFGPTESGTIDVNDDDPIKLPYAGEYTITINTNDNTYPFTITRTIETVATPTFTPVDGVYTSAQSVTISCTTPGATIHYTTDGSTPTSSSPVYSEAIPVSATTTIRAIAVKAGWYDSNEATGTYTIRITSAITLAQLEQLNGGTIDNHYAISDELIGAWAAGDILWAKDYNSYSGYEPNDTRAACQTGQIDYLREIPTHNGNEEYFWQNRDWDESDWIALDFSHISGTSASSYVGKKLTDIEGFYINNVNYILQLTKAPTIGEDVNGYPGYSSDNTNYPNPDHSGYGSENDNWHYNTYIPANFYTSNHNKDMNGIIVGLQTHNIQTDTDEHLYFMNPKIQEVARIWGVWNAEKATFTVYSTPWYNHYEPRISGAVNAIWDYNVRGDISSELTTGDAYCFHAVVSKIPSRSRITANGPEASDDEPSSDYAIHPLDFVSAQSNWTAVSEVKGDNRMIESVTYYNVMGQQSKSPFEGINIVVTRYSDGSTSASKVLR